MSHKHSCPNCGQAFICNDAECNGSPGQTAPLARIHRTGRDAEDIYIDTKEDNSDAMPDAERLQPAHTRFEAAMAAALYTFRSEAPGYDLKFNYTVRPARGGRPHENISGITREQAQDPEAYDYLEGTQWKDAAKKQLQGHIPEELLTTAKQNPAHPRGRPNMTGNAFKQHDTQLAAQHDAIALLHILRAIARVIKHHELGPREQIGLNRPSPLYDALRRRIPHKPLTF